MKTYSGRLWLVPFRDSKLRVEIGFEDDNIKITSSDSVIGDWPLTEVVIRSSSKTEVRLSAEGEELVIFTRDADFIPALSAHKSKAERAGAEIDKEPVAVRPTASLDTNVVSFDRDRRPRPASAPAEEARAAAAGGSGNSAESAESDRGTHKSEGKMLWKW